MFQTTNQIWYLNGNPPIKQPCGVYSSRVDITLQSMWETLQLKPTVSSSWDGVTAPFCGEFGDGSLLLGLPQNMILG